MKLATLALMVSSLVACGATVPEQRQPPTKAVVIVAKPAPTVREIPPEELKRRLAPLLVNCPEPQLKELSVENLKQTNNARGEALESCNERLRKAREKLGITHD